MARLHYNFLGGLVEDNPLLVGATTLNSAGLAALPAIASPDIVPITIDPDGIFGAPEIAHITAHAAGATSATILREQEGTTKREHPRDIEWVHSFTAESITYKSVVQVRRTTSQSITAANTETPIVFDTEDLDTGGFADIVANNDGVNLTPGVWFIQGSVPLDLATGSGATMQFLLKAGTANLASIRKVVNANTAEVVELFTMANLGATTEIQLVVSSTLTTNVVSGGYLRNPTLYAIRLGR